MTMIALPSNTSYYFAKKSLCYNGFLQRPIGGWLAGDSLITKDIFQSSG
jgi:hypothetical protein